MKPIEGRIYEDGLMETGVKGVRLFCAPAVYEPTVVVIVSGAKEAIMDGTRYVYDSRHYMCCPMLMPVEAGMPDAPPDNPLLGVTISLDKPDAAPPRPIRPIRPGFQSGTDYPRRYLTELRQLGVNHVALNLWFNGADLETTMKRLADEILPDFAS